jgi:hypothetical protein
VRTGLLPIIRALNGWITEHYDSGFDPVDDETATIRARALLVLDQLELLRSKVINHQTGKAKASE